MKNIPFKPILYICFLFLLLTSCKKWVDEDLNVDPNNPSDVSEALLLPGTQASFAYIMGGDYGRYNSLFTQHHAGVDRQHLGIDNYTFRENDVNNSWESMYSSVLFELNIIISKAGASNSPHYAGVAKVMSAMALMHTTDLFGDIPYSSAFKGASQLQTPYDKQDAIYQTIIRFCTEATSDLAASTSTFTPGTNDLIYGGDKAKWSKAANALKARAYLHLGKVSAQNYTNAIAAIGAGTFTSNTDDAVFVFGNSQANANPLYQFVTQRGDIRMSKFFIDLLNSKNDPRLPFFADSTDGGTYVGALNGAGESATSNPGTYYASINSPVPLITYYEVKFIEAESKFRTGDLGGAASAFNDAVSASLTKITGSANAGYILINANETAGTISLEKILTQKYIAMYMQPESFTDVRRTGIPALTPVSGNQLPERWPYPQSERLYNSSNFPGQKTLFDKLWWNN